MFCANLGHDKGTCPERIRMLRLSRDPRFKDRPGMKEMTKDRVGPWINNQNSIHRPNWSIEKDDTSGTNTVSGEKREKNYKNTNPNRANSTETGAQSAKAHKANTEEGDNGSDRLESPIGSGLGVDLNYPDREKAVNRRRKGKDLQMQIEVPSQTTAQKRMGQNLSPGKNRWDMQIVEGNTGSNSEGDEWYTTTHANKKRAVEASSVLPPQEK